MFYHPHDYKFIYTSCDKWEFVRSIATYSHMTGDGQPVFEDHRGHYAILRKNNWTKFDIRSAEKFMRNYFETDAEFERWKFHNRELLNLKW